MNSNLRRALALGTAAALAAATLACANGCRETDVLKELINDQTSDNIDYDNPTKLYIDTPDADLTSEDYAEMKQTEQAEIERERHNTKAVEDDKEDNNLEAANVEHDQSPTGNATGGASFTESPGEEEGDGTGNEDGDGEDGEDDEGGGGEGGDSADGDSEGTGDTISKGKGGVGMTVDYQEEGNDPDQGIYSYVVAFGECANMVMMLAGKDSLAGADAEFLNNDFIQKAYKDEGIDDVKKIDIKNGIHFDVDKVINLKPDAVFLMADTFTVSEEDQAKLEDAEIDIVYLPNMKSHTSTKSLARLIGKMFGDETETNSKINAMERAEEYRSYIQNLVDTIQSQNGGLTTVSGVNYNTGKTNASESVSTAAADMDYALYIYDYDFDSQYEARSSGSKLWDASGVALAKTGYKWSPLSYYMSVGGVNNNAAQFHVSNLKPTALYHVWQFSLDVMPANDSDFDYLSISTSKMENWGSKDLLVRAQDGNNKRESLGSDNFRNVIVGSQKVGEAMESDRDKGTKNQEGLYAAYKYNTPKSGNGQNGIGLYDPDGNILHSYIGFVNDTANGSNSTKSSTAYSRYEKGDNPYEIVVNPHGLYSSWTDGSVESSLECSWIYDLYHGDEKDFDNTKSYISEFYKLFYGYDLSDKEIKTILAGAEE